MGQHANEMAFAEAGSENVKPDMGDEKVETPDVVNGASNVTATFFAPTIFHKATNPVLVQSPVHLHKVICCLLRGTRGRGVGLARYCRVARLIQHIYRSFLRRLLSQQG